MKTDFTIRQAQQSDAVALKELFQKSSLLQKELPGLRGFSTRSIKNMRQFYEEWEVVLIWQPLAAEFNWPDFLSIGFSHHIEIIAKAKTLEARLFYIHECATRYWSKYTLRDYLKADLYSHRGTLPNNFAQTRFVDAIWSKRVNGFTMEQGRRSYCFSPDDPNQKQSVFGEYEIKEDIQDIRLESQRNWIPKIRFG